MLKWIRRSLLSLLRPITWALGRVTRQKTLMTEEAYWETLKRMQVGDVILLRGKRRPTNLVIPGFWSHAAFHVGDGDTVDAAFPEVRESTLMELMLRADFVAILRPDGFTQDELDKAAETVRQTVGKPYDFMFDPGHEALYCSELCWMGLLSGKPTWGFEARERMGVLTVTPQDLYDSGRFTILHEIK